MRPSDWTVTKKEERLQAAGIVIGLGVDGYGLAIEALARHTLPKQP